MIETVQILARVVSFTTQINERHERLICEVDFINAVGQLS